MPHTDMRADFSDWLHQEVRLAPATGLNEYGELAYGPETLVLGRIERKRTRLLTKDNEVVISTCTIYLPSAPVIQADDRLTLPDGTTPVILGVDKQPDEQGAIYYQAVLT